MSPDSTTSTPQLLTDQDLYLFNEGSNYRIYEKMGAHLVTHNGEAGAVFSVWAPNAKSISVVGSFNGWDPKTHRLAPRGSSGIWEGFIPGVTKGALYKFHIESQRQRIQRRQSRSSRPDARETSAHCVGRLGSRLPMGRSRLDGRPRPAQFAARAARDLRSASRFVDARSQKTQPLAHLPRDCAATR